MKLLELYSLATGLKIGKQFLLEQFFPLPFDKYIVLHASSGMTGKNYLFFAEVVGLIKPFLDAQGIQIVQIGEQNDQIVPGCYNICGKTSLHQANYLVKNALALVGNDSVWAHRAGHIGTPLLAEYGPTSEANHSPLDFDPDKSIFLSSHRRGNNPTFAAQETPQTVAYICPFLVARSVLQLLGIPHNGALDHQTIYVGPTYNGFILDICPNVPVSQTFNPAATAAVRMDLCHNEEILAQILQSGRKVNILTKAPISLNLLAALKGNILSYNHEIDESCPVDYLKQVTKILPRAVFFSRKDNQEELAALRFKFFEIIRIEQILYKTRADFEAASKEYSNDPAFSLDSDGKLSKLRFKTNKFVLSKGKIYLSLAHERLDQPIVGNAVPEQVIDAPDFWCDQIHTLVFV